MYDVFSQELLGYIHFILCICHSDWDYRRTRQALFSTKAASAHAPGFTNQWDHHHFLLQQNEDSPVKSGFQKCFSLWTEWESWCKNIDGQQKCTQCTGILLSPVCCFSGCEEKQLYATLWWCLMHMQYVSYLSEHGQTLVEKKMSKKVTRQSLRLWRQATLEKDVYWWHKHSDMQFAPKTHRAFREWGALEMERIQLTWVQHLWKSI